MVWRAVLRPHRKCVAVVSCNVLMKKSEVATFMERSKSFLHPPAPVRQSAGLSKLPNRSHSIVDLLKAVEAGKRTLVSPEAYLPKSSPQRQPAMFPESQEELFRRSSFVMATSVFDADEAALEKKRLLDKNVVQFPQELRGNNRFFSTPELGTKASALLQESRRPSSLFSESITSSCREELNTIHRIKKYETIKLSNWRLPRRAATPAAQLSPFRELGPSHQLTEETAPRFLVHVDESEREDLPAREKLGRRVEYGRMVSMFREEMLASKIDRHCSASKHPEVESAKSDNHERILDWSFCDMDDPVQLMDIFPRDGVVLLGMGKEVERKVLRGQPNKGAGSQTKTTTSDRKATAEITACDPNKKSPIWQLKYCFNDEDADGIIAIQRGMVVVESGGTKYAFDPSKQPKSRDLDAEAESQLSPEKRARLRWLKMTPDQREKQRVQNLLNCGKSYEGRHVNLANNRLRRLDKMLTNTLATVLRNNVTKLDLSFNRIEMIDWSFLNVNIQEHEERKKFTLADAMAHEEEEMRQATLTNGGLLSDAQRKKQRDAFLQLRSRAVADLVDANAAHRVFHHLQTLYLHGNPLRDIGEIWKLAPLRYSLAYLTFHGQYSLDAQARDPKIRLRLRETFPKLVQLNFTTLLPIDDELHCI